MNITITLNGKKISEEIDADLLLIDFVRNHGCYSVKRGCETSNCGLCTVFLDEKPVLSCSVLAARVDGRSVTTLEGLQDEAKEFGAFIADQGAGAVRILQSWLHYERAGAVPGKTNIRIRRKSRNIWRATYAAAPATRDSFAVSRHFSHGRKKRTGDGPVRRACDGRTVTTRKTNDVRLLQIQKEDESYEICK